MANNKIRFIVEVQGDQAAKQYQAIERQLEAIKKQQSEVAKGSKDWQDLEKQAASLRRELKTLEPTYEALTKRKRALERQLKRLTPGTEQYIAVQRELADVVPLWTRQRDAIRNVGRAQERAAKSTGIMSKAVGGLGSIIRTALGPVGALITIGSALVAAFTRSSEGSKLLREGMALLNAVLDAVTRQINNLLKNLRDVKTLEDFGKMLRENIELRLTAALTAVRGFGSAIGKLLKGDFEGARTAAQDATVALASFVTGLDEDTIKQEAEAIKENTKEQLRFANARRNAAATVARLNLEITKLSAKEQLLNTQADDSTRSLQERFDLSVQALRAAEDRAAKEIELAKAQAAVINQEIALRRKAGQDVTDLVASQLDATAQITAAELALQQVREENGITQRELQSDLIEQRLDVLIDGYDFEKSIRERTLADERLSAIERKQIIEELVADGKRLYSEQIATIQAGTSQLIDENELLAITDADMLAERIKSYALSETLSTRLLEIIKERRIAIQDLKETEQEYIEAIEPLQARYTDNTVSRIQIEAQARADAQQKRIEQARSIAETEIELENEVRAARTKGFQAIGAASDKFFTDGLAWLSRDENARRKNAKTIKRLQKLQVLTALPAEIANIWASASTLPPPFGQIKAGILTGAALLRTRKNLADIDAAQFADGGYTGRGIGAPDKTGQRPVGVVHEDEWVAPKWMATHPQLGATIAALEQVRQRGFAAGGYTTLTAMPQPNPAMASSLNTAGLETALRDLLQQREPLRAFVVYDQFETKRVEIESARNAASI